MGAREDLFRNLMFGRDCYSIISYRAFVQSVIQQHSRFPSAKWTLLVQAARTVSPGSRQALKEPGRACWPPLYACLRRSGSKPHEDRNLGQGYLSRPIGRNDLQSVAPAQGCFRSRLLAGSRNFLARGGRHQSAQKRGGGGLVISFETEGLEGEAFIDREAVAPDEAYDHSWAEPMLRRAVNVLHGEYAARGRSARFDVLKPSFGGGSEAQTTRGRGLGMTPGAVAVAGPRLRLRELGRLEVAQTGQDPAGIEDERRSLMASLPA